MSKDFDSWNNLKKSIHADGLSRYVKPREIWWIRLGVNIGFEEDGKGQENSRPMLVIFCFSKNTFLAVPLTTSDLEHKYRLEIGEVGGKKSKAIISQIRVVDTKRCVKRIAVLDKDIFSKITKSIKDLL